MAAAWTIVKLVIVWSSFCLLHHTGTVKGADVLDTRKTTTPAHFELKPGLTPTVYLKHKCEWTWIKGWYDVYVESQNTKVDSYASGTYCIIQMVVTRYYGINITFERFDMEPKNETTNECEDYVAIIDVVERKASTPHICGNKIPASYIVNHNHAAVLFVTDNDTNVFSGFRMYMSRIRLPSVDPKTYKGIKDIYGTSHTNSFYTRPPWWSSAPPTGSRWLLTLTCTIITLLFTLRLASLT